MLPYSLGFVRILQSLQDFLRALPLLDLGGHWSGLFVLRGELFISHQPFQKLVLLVFSTESLLLGVRQTTGGFGLLEAWLDLTGLVGRLSVHAMICVATFLQSIIYCFLHRFHLFIKFIYLCVIWKSISSVSSMLKIQPQALFEIEMSGQKMTGFWRL